MTATVETVLVAQAADDERIDELALARNPLQSREFGNQRFEGVDDELLAIYNSSNIHLWDLANLQARLSQLGLNWE